jgi:Fe-S-cluster containining protein
MSQIAFDCQRCSQCCHGEGGISLLPEEVPEAAGLLGLSAQEFSERYCQFKQGRYLIKTNQDGDCALLGPEGCLIHQAKPRICRRWPFFQALLRDPGAFEEAKLSCPGLLPQASFQDFLAQYRAEGGEEDI